MVKARIAEQQEKGTRGNKRSDNINLLTLQKVKVK
jgi:hypothetical protein